MSGLLDNPVLLREVRSWLRLRRLCRTRSSLVTVISVGSVVFCLYGCILWEMLWATWTITGEEWPDVLQPIWFWATRLLLLVIVFVCPTLAATSIVRERELRTWEALALTRLRGRDILLGKWLASLTPVLMAALVVMPLLAVAYVRSTIPATGLLAVLLFLPATAAVYCLFGLFCSFMARTSSVARTLSLTVSLFLCFGTLICDSIFRGLVASDMRPFSLINNDWYGGSVQDYGVFGLPSLSWLSPFYVFAVLTRWTQYHPTLSDTPDLTGDDTWTTHPSSVFLTYGLCMALAAGFCLYYILTRYRRDVRGGRPLGEPIT